jgi:thiol-disulfide isomerase/thioredoxin
MFRRLIFIIGSILFLTGASAYAANACQVFQEVEDFQAQGKYNEALQILKTKGEECPSANRGLLTLKEIELEMLFGKYDNPNLARIQTRATDDLKGHWKAYVLYLQAAILHHNRDFNGTMGRLLQVFSIKPSFMLRYRREKERLFSGLKGGTYATKIDNYITANLNDDPKIQQKIQTLIAKPSKTNNRYLILEFYADWCPDCIEVKKILNTQNFQDYLRKRNIEIVTVDVGEFSKNLSLVIEHNITGITTLVALNGQGIVKKIGPIEPVTGKNKGNSSTPEELMKALEALP